MLLTHLEIEHLCQYVDFKWDFEPGLIGIMGPNGIGKSNLIQLIKASVTNDFKFKGRTKPQQIRRGTGDDVQARVLTAWEHGGTEFEVQRSLQKPSGSILRVDGESPLSKTPDIQTRLWEIIGVPPTVLDDHVFVGQGEILKFLSEKPAVRKDNFAELCGAGHIEKIWDALGDRIRDDAHLTVNFVDNSEELQARIVETEADIVGIEHDLEEAKRGTLKAARIRYLKLLVSKKERLTSAKIDLEAKRDDIKTTGEQLRKLRSLTSAHAIEVSTEFKWLEKHRKQYDKDKADLSILPGLRSQKASYDKAKAAVDTEPEPQPEKPTGYLDAAEFRPILQEKQRELAEAEEVLGLFNEEGVVQCPTCKTNVEHLESHLELMRRREEHCPNAIRSLSRSIRISEEHDDAVDFWADAEQKRKWAYDEGMHVLSGMSEPEVPNVDEANARIETYDSHKQGHKELTDDLAPRQQRLAKMEGRHEQLETDLNAIQETVDENEVDDDDVEDAKGRLSRHDVAKASKEQLESSLFHATERLKETQEELRRVQDLKSRTRKGQKWLADLEAWREVVHRDNFPRIYMASVLEDLVDQVNELLNEFDGPFYVSAGDDLSFTVHNPDGSSEPAASKSGGEMVVLAIAYRLAVNSRFARDVGMMVLDEPSAFLDQKNLGCLASVLQRICEVMKQRRQQLIMITHDQRLERVFDQLIELG